MAGNCHQQLQDTAAQQPTGNGSREAQWRITGVTSVEKGAPRDPGQHRNSNKSDADGEDKEDGDGEERTGEYQGEESTAERNERRDPQGEPKVKGSIAEEGARTVGKSGLT